MLQFNRLIIVAFLAAALAACALPTTQPPTATAAPPSPTPTSPPPSPTPSPVPPTATAEPAVITAENVLDLRPAHVLTGHGNSVTALDFSPNGERLVVAAGAKNLRPEHRLRLWDVATGELLAISEEMSTIVWDVAYAPDGSVIAAALDDGRVLFLDPDSLGLISFFNHQGPVNSVAFSPDGGLMATGVAQAQGGVIVLWELSGRTILRSFFAHAFSVPGLAFNPTGQFLASGAVDRTVRVWQVSDGREVAGLPQDGQGTSVFFSGDGSLLGTAMCALSDATLQCKRGEVWLYDVPSWGLVRKLTGPVDWVDDAVISPDHGLVAGAGRDGAVYLWRLRDASLQRALVGHTGGVTAIAFSPDGSTLASGSSDESVILWRMVP